MHDTRVATDPNAIVERRVQGYSSSPDGAFLIDDTALHTQGDSGVLTRLHDFVLWEQYLNDPPDDALDLVRQMFTTSPLTDGQQGDYGGGFWIGSYRGVGMHEHGGGGDGFRTQFIRFPGQHIAVIALCNGGRAISARRLAFAVADELLEESSSDTAGAATQTSGVAPFRDQRVSVPDEILQALAGSYLWTDDGYLLLMVSVDTNRLLLGYSGYGEYELAPLSADRFLIADFNRATTPRYLAAVRNEEGRIVGLRYEGEEVDPRFFARVLDSDPSAARRVAGVYECDDLDAAYRVSASEDGLVIRLDEPTSKSLFPEPLLYLGADRWATGGYTTFQFRRDGNGVSPT